jgi:hypothetical protein
MIVAQVVLTVAYPFAVELYTPLEQFRSSFNTSLFVVLAMFTGARLADAGYSRWIGYGGLVGLLLVLPIAAVLLVLFGLGIKPKDSQFAFVVGLIVIFCLLLAIGFVIWVGTRPSAPSDNWADVFGEPSKRDAALRERIEPHF